MSVFSKFKDFLYRHRNKFVVTGVLVSGVYFASRYAQHKLREWQERETKEFLDRTRKAQHFESTERTCNQTIVSLSITLHNVLSSVINTDELVADLRTSPVNKVELWEKLKVLVFSKVCTLVYINTILAINLRIQLNLVGGYLYKDTKQITSEIQESYLSISHLLLDSGLKTISNLITTKVTDIVRDMKLTKKLNLYDVEQVFWSVQVKLCESTEDPIKKIKEFIIPNEIADVKDVYHDMMRETADLLESNDVQNLATTCTNRGFSHFIDKLSEYYAPVANGTIDGPSSSKDIETFLHPSKVEIPLAKLIPIMNGLMSRNSFPESLTQQLINDQKLKLLGANIYEVFSS